VEHSFERGPCNDLIQIGPVASEEMSKVYISIVNNSVTFEGGQTCQAQLLKMANQGLF